MPIKVRTRGVKKTWGLTKALITDASELAAGIAQRKNLSAVFNAIYVDDATIAQYHEEYLNDPTPTDVISFHMDETDPSTGEYVLGDLVISYETAMREANKRKITITEELLLYTIHGFLHLLGYEDNTPSSSKKMSDIQKQVLKQIFK